MRCTRNMRFRQKATKKKHRRFRNWELNAKLAADQRSVCNTYISQFENILWFALDLVISIKCVREENVDITNQRKKRDLNQLNPFCIHIRPGAKTTHSLVFRQDLSVCVLGVFFCFKPMKFKLKCIQWSNWQQQVYTPTQISSALLFVS